MHRMLWRTSWLSKLSSDSRLTPILARSGQVLLFERSDSKTSHVISKHEIKKKGLVATLTVLLGSVFLLLGFQGNSKTATERPMNVSSEIPVPNCERQMAHPSGSIKSWLANEATVGISVVELGREVIGGVQSRLIELACETKAIRFRLKLTKEEKQWHLTKITRLDDQPGNSDSRKN